MFSQVMGEVHAVLFNCSRFLCDTKPLIDGKVSDKNCMTYSALLFPLTKVLNSAEIIHLAHTGKTFYYNEFFLLQIEFYFQSLKIQILQFLLIFRHLLEVPACLETLNWKIPANLKEV